MKRSPSNARTTHRTTTSAARTRHATPPTRQERGTVLLFALGVLAVIAVAALSYVTFVRLDRQSAAAVQRGVGFERQVNVVRDHIRALLTADLYGGKLVSRDLPRQVGDVEVWPRMFEDGEYRDYPWTAFWSFNQTAPGNRTPNTEPSVLSLRSYSTGGKTKYRFETAPRDDAWLASSDPSWTDNSSTMRGWWRQITNLRSGYVYDDNGTPTNPRDDRWVRGDGRYADLAQIFIDPQSSGGTPRGNPGTDFLDPTLNLGNGNGAVLPIDAAGDYARAPFEQIFFMDEDQNPVFERQDERYWADTDGDLRPDARWQVLEGLGNFNGLVWFTAARIIDASAFLNYNTAVDGGYGAFDPGDIGTGRTPADIDLPRLLWSARQDLGIPRRYTFDGSGPAPALNIVQDQTQFEKAMNAHMIERFGARAIMRKINDDSIGDPFSRPGILGPAWKWSLSGQRPSQLQRDALWRWYGSSPLRARMDLESVNFDETTLGYKLNDTADLFTYSGANRRASLSLLEEVFDGPDYLPQQEDRQPLTGPLLSDARSADSRTQGTTLTGSGGEGHPTARERRFGTRNHLTPWSGVGKWSPVPVLNRDAFLPAPQTAVARYANRFSNQRISLRNFQTSDIAEAFGALVWALAPLATDEPLSERLWIDGVGAPITGELIGNDTSYHYGGTSTLGGAPPGPVQRVPGYIAGDQTGASFAVLTAAQLALNLKDMIDADDTPSVARFFYADGEGLHDSPATSLIELSTSFSHGDIPAKLLAAGTVGDRFESVSQFDQISADFIANPASQDPAAWLEEKAAQTGMTIVGLERHPYIMEVFTAAGYTNVPEPGAGNAPTPNNQIQVTDPNYQLGALVAVQLANPWPDPLPMDRYEVRLVGDDLNINSNAPEEVLRLAFPSNTVIPAGGMATYVFAWDRVNGSLMGKKNPADDEYPVGLGVVDIVKREVEAVQAFGFEQRAMTLANFTDDTAAETWLNDNAVFFRHVARADMKVLLVLPSVGELPEVDKATGRKAAVVLDRITANLGAGDVFPMVPQTAVVLYGNVLFDEDFDRLVLGDARGYELDPGINDLGPAGNAIDVRLSSEVGGRYMVTSSLTRPIKRSASGGFPGYVIDFDTPGFATPATKFVKAEFAHGWLPNILENGPDGDPLTTDDNDPSEIVNKQGAGVGQTIADFVVKAESRTIGDNLIVRRVPTDPEAHALHRVDTSVFGKPADDDFDIATILPGWQLFIPNAPLDFRSEVGMASVYGTLCRNHQVNNLNEWRTVGQQLALSLTYDHDALPNPAAPAGKNPYLGVLDPSRFIPTGPSFIDAGKVPDEALAIPLALRVFDCFEALELWGDESLIPGVVNISNASERVMESLPLLAPVGGIIPGTNLTPTRERVRMIYRYRDGVYPGETFMTPNVMTNMNASNQPLRRGDLMVASWLNPNVAQGQTQPSGFATAAELAILDTWNNDGSVATTTGFVGALGADGANTGPPADVWTASKPHWDPPGASLPEVLANEPADDAEERLALYRAVSNIVSSRSDVYIAWFVIRGYDPDKIEGITLDGNGEAAALLAMESDDPEFAPAYESRWLVVLDRSNVERPTDRPRILFQAELPSAKP